LAQVFICVNIFFNKNYIIHSSIKKNMENDVVLDSAAENVEFRGFHRAREDRLAALRELEEKRQSTDGLSRDEITSFNKAKARALETEGLYDFVEVAKYYLKPHEWTTVSKTPSAPPWEEFVSPKLGIRNAEKKGRGLFAKEPIKEGELIFAEKALHVGKNENFVKTVRSLVEAADELTFARFFRLSGKDGSKDAKSIAENNRHSTQLINIHRTPVEVTTDPDRSGIWLTAALLNHSCAPNVQRIICDQWIFVRACKDIAADEELEDGYIELLQPHEYRQKHLKEWGFQCECSRCCMEKSVLNADTVNRVLEQAVKARTVDQIEDVLVEVQRATLEASERYCSPNGFSVSKMAQLTQQFGRFSSPEEESRYKKQKDIALCLSTAFGNIYKQLCIVLTQEVNPCKSVVQLCDALETYGAVIGVVLPNSEVMCKNHNEILSVRLLGTNMEVNKVTKDLAERAMNSFNLTYGGGSDAWALFSDNLFAPEVRQKFEEFGIKTKPPFTALEVPPIPEEKPDPNDKGFYGKMRGQLKPSADKRDQSGKNSSETEENMQKDKDSTPKTATNTSSKPLTNRESENDSGVECGDTKTKKMKAGEVDLPYRITDSENGMTVIVNGITSMENVSVYTNKEELRVECSDRVHEVKLAYPVEDNPVAKWSRKKSTLTISLVKKGE